MNTSSFVLIAIAKINRVFKMLLSIVILFVQDDSIRIDLSKYKAMMIKGF